MFESEMRLLMTLLLNLFHFD